MKQSSKVEQNKIDNEQLTPHVNWFWTADNLLETIQSIQIRIEQKCKT